MVRLFLKRGAIIGAVVLGAEAAYAVLRPSPMFEQFDPSSSFGDADLPHMRVAVLGDSSITAPGVAGPHEIWVTLIGEKLAVDRHVILQSFAVGGSTADDLVRDQLEPALQFEPNLILVSVGGNDLLKGVSRSTFEGNLDDLIGPLAASGAVVVQSGLGDLGTIPRLHPPLRYLVSRRSAAFDRIHWKIAQKHGTHVVHQRSDSREAWLDDRGLWSDDLFHVSAAGHARWADTVWNTTIEPLLPVLNESS